MLILQLSDLHFTAGGPAFGHGTPETDLKNTVDYLLGAPFAPDLVVVTGDLSTDGSPDSYRAAMTQLSRLPWPLYLLPGNHDDRDAMAQICGPLCRMDPVLYPHCQNRLELPEVTLLFLDSVRPGEGRGGIPSHTLDWVQHNLPADRTRPTLVFLHHVPFPTGLPLMDKPVENLEPLLALLRGYSNLLICCGHIHTPITALHHGVRVAACPPVCMQMELDFRAGAPAPRPGGDAYFTAEPMFALHRITGNTVVTHFAAVPTGQPRTGPWYFHP